MKKDNLLAPDGGWGWLVVFAYSLNNMIVIPILQGFGLLYQDLLEDLKFSTVDTNTILTVNSSFGMLLALFNGPIMRNFGYRKVAILGVLLIFFGNLLTSQAYTFLEFILEYGILVSAGMNFVMSSFNLALNTYFVEKRGPATAISMTCAGIGPIVMPQVIAALMRLYGIRDTGMLLSALCLHSLIGATLLQPVKWHYRKRKPVEEVATKEECEVILEKQEEILNADEAIDSEMISNTSFYQSSSDDTIQMHTKVGFPTSDNAEDECRYETKKEIKTSQSTPAIHLAMPSLSPIESEAKSKSRPSFLQRVSDFFDFELFSDPIYTNVVVGLSLAFVAEMNFSLMTPFVFKDRRLNADQVATIMSSIAAADLLSRFLSPCIGKVQDMRTRYVYVASLMAAVIFRFVLIFCTTYLSMIMVAVGLGIAKGVRSVYMVLVIPNYVPLEKLASATGLQITINGILLALFGPLFGKVKDTQANYDLWICVINGITLVTISLWFVEWMLVKKSGKSSSQLDVAA